MMSIRILLVGVHELSKGDGSKGSLVSRADTDLFNEKNKLIRAE